MINSDYRKLMTLRAHCPLTEKNKYFKQKSQNLETLKKNQTKTINLAKKQIVEGKR